jgi:hypothetical protein
MRHQPNSSIMGSSRRGLLVLSVVASLFVAAPAAPAPIHYDINFTLASGSPLPTAGGFDYDPAIPASFSNFIVVWHGSTYELTAEANSPTESGGSAFSTSCGLTGPPLAFALLSKNSCVVSVADALEWFAFEQDVIADRLFEFRAFVIDPLSGLPIITLAISQHGGPTPGNDFEFAFGEWEIASTAVSEPPTAGLIMLCLAVLAGLARRRQRSRTDAARRPT